LEVVVIPTHRAMVRQDHGDLVYLTAKEKFDAIIQDIKDCYQRGQPVLVGTTSIEISEYLAQLLDNEKIKHQVLNAKQHEREAQIVVEAGRPGGVTIATNMAGRGTDIVLGGSLEAELSALGENPDAAAVERAKEEWRQRHDQVLAAGGLHVIGTERHESRRIDNQLRGRSGRQGDPGSSRFYLSLEDNLMRIFASDRVKGLMQKLGMEAGEAIEHPWVTRAIENAQRKVEGHNFDIRKQLLDYDDVANDQRKVIYEQRNEIMATDDISETIKTIRVDVINGIINAFVPPQSLEEQWDVAGLEEALEQMGVPLPVSSWLEDDHDLHEEILRQRILEAVEAAYAEKEAQTGAEVMRHFEKAVMLQVLDSMWKEHLAAMDYLRQGIGLRGYAQKNPIQEYKREAFELFTQLLNKIKTEVISILTRVRVRAEEDVQAVEQQRRSNVTMRYEHAEATAMAAAGGGGDVAAAEDQESHTPYVRDGRKIGRNEPCPCGSGKKYKQCHGRLE
jgi:preprotein translocase subunit SecA